MGDTKTENSEFCSSKETKDSYYFGRPVPFPLNIILYSTNAPILTVQAAGQTVTYTCVHSQCLCSYKTQYRKIYEFLFQKPTSKLQFSDPTQGSRQLRRSVRGDF